MQSHMRFYNLIVILSFAAFAFGTYPTQPAQPDQNESRLQQFDLINPTAGWVLIDDQLFWTSDAGQTWDAINPSIPMDANVQDVEFIDFNTGWILWTTNNVDGSANFMLAQTRDHGNNWNMRALALFESGEMESHSEESNFGWFDAQTGWITVKQSTSSNFSLGTLFTTSDGGNTWAHSALPVADHVTFSDPQTGWAYGDAGRNQFFKTNDGGISWQNSEPDPNIDDLQNFPGKLETFKNQDGLSASITALDMISLEVGWAKSVDAKCTTASSPNDGLASVSCTSLTRLLQTSDGGVTWQNVQLPLVEAGITSSRSFESNQQMTVNAIANPGNTETLIGQGFDQCEVPTLSQLQTWWDNSPYKAVNLYIGGSNRACSNNALTSAYLAQLHQQGWKFIPTWVGPQAPCTGYNSRMSSDPVIAYDQGVNEANLAVERLAQLGLTYPDKTGSVVYYDIEYYGTNTACRTAVNSFMNGWVSQVHVRANLAGVYGSVRCNTGLSDFLTITNVPDVIWAAGWYHNSGEGYYDPTASVWDLGSCLPNTVWADHQRIRQYEGDHYETWGNLTLRIDSDVLDGVVAIPYTLPYVSSITRVDSNPTFEDTVDFLVTFTDLVTDVDILDFTLNTTGMTDASILTVSGSGATYVITAHTGTANGTIRLDVPDTATINDRFGNAINFLPFTGGETYTVYNTMAFFTSAKTYDGWILESSETSNIGGTLNKTAAILRVGDDAANKQYRSFLSFDTTPMPDTAVITSVTVKFKYAGLSGVDPFTTHGNLLADIRKGTFSNNVALQLTDFNAKGAVSTYKSKALIYTNNPVDNWYSQSFNPIDFSYVNLLGITQFRLRFGMDDNNDFGADFLKIFSGNALIETDRPQLVIEYYVP